MSPHPIATVERLSRESGLLRAKGTAASLYPLDDRRRQLGRRQLAAQVARQLAVGKRLLNRPADRGGGLVLAQPLEHHCRAEDRAGRNLASSPWGCFSAQHLPNMRKINVAKSQCID
jgi:hypothetical protein